VPDTSRGRPAFEHGFIAVFVVLYVALAWATIPHYGITWDCGEYYIGDKNFYYDLTLDSTFLDYRIDNVPTYRMPGHPNFYLESSRQIKNPEHVWPLGPTAAAASEWLFWTKLGIADPMDAHNMAVPLFVAVLLPVFYYFVLANFGLWEAIVAVVALAAYPRFWADAHNNLKDIPSTALFTIVLILAWWGITSGRLRPLVAGAILWGIAFTAKANVLFVPVVLLPWFVAHWWRKRGTGEPPMTRRVLLTCLAWPAIALPFYFLFWPWLLLDWPNHFNLQIAYLKWRGASGPDYWQIHPLENALATMPLPVMILAALALVLMARQWLLRRTVEPLHVLVLSWLVIPVLRVSIPTANDFDVIRHWMEFVPALAIMSGIGGAWLIRRIFAGIDAATGAAAGAGAPSLSPPNRRPALGLAIVLVFFSPVLAWCAKNHPNEIVFYNSLVGGLGGAQARGFPESTDYWGQSYRQGARWLNANAEPDSLVVVGVSSRIVSYTRDIWLRPDLRQVLGPADVQDPELDRAIQFYSGHVYLMYITRKQFYWDIVTRYDNLPPTWKIDVDGGTILKVYRLK
jgi:hypothetical protein